ncbi:unnamed protein product [Cyclocybe aegerita]|uniref:Nudix hydrolase domain-containing protein n=2 Tax=Agaricineae TaxID=2982305 RepID=A0A8S0WUK4_CYCAE|nr:unnamed protein product [Cyclocybe aegerita]
MPPSLPSAPTLSPSLPRTPSLPYQWSTRPSHNSIFDLSPTLDLSEPSGVNAAQLMKALIASAVLQYTSTAIVMPWEVGKLLMQVQWVPRDAGEVEEADGEVDGQGEGAEDVLSDDDTSEGDSYFADPGAIPATRPPVPRTKVDDHGHVVRHSVLEEGSRPEYIIPVGSADGVWGMMKRVGRFRSEGWLALWKGLLTSCVTEVLSDTLQPLINGFLQSLFFPSMSPFHQPPIVLPVASHLITGFLLSPLDLIRTRLIIQSFTTRYRTYTGPIDAFKQIHRDEGGLHGMYMHPQLLIPALLDNALRPIVALALPGMLTAYFGWGHITEDTHPIGWGLAELGGSCIGLLVTLPIETIRRRLQAQVRGTAQPIKAAVELRPAPYNGVVDAFWHILTEERSDLPIARSTTRKRRRMSVKGKERAEDGAEAAQAEGSEEGRDEYQSWFRHTGLGQLTKKPMASEPPTVPLLARALHRIRATPPRIITSPPTQPRRAAVALIIRVVPAPNAPVPQIPEKPPTLPEFFDQDWVNHPHARPEILYLHRENHAATDASMWQARINHKQNEAHVAFPGGRQEPDDEGGLYTAMRQTWEEIGIDLAEPCYTCVGQLDDREITTSLGKRLLMILSPFVFLQFTPHAPPPDPVDTTTLHWTPLTSLVSINTPPRWSNVTVDAASRLAPKHSSFLRLLVRVFIGSMEFPAIVLQPSASSPFASPQLNGDSKTNNEKAAPSSNPKTSNPKSQGLLRPQQLKLWGLSLGMTLDLMSYMILPPPTSQQPSHTLKDSPPSSPLSSVMQLPYQHVVEDFRMEYVAPSLASVFPRFSYPDVNFWIWVFGKRYREVVRGWEASVRGGGTNDRRINWSGTALNTFYAAIRKALVVVIIARALGVLFGVSFAVWWIFS